MERRGLRPATAIIMNAQITTPQTFEQKMMDRIKDSIGDLLSDDDLKRIVEQGIEKALFEKRTVHSGTGSWNDRVEDSLVDKAVREFLDERVTDAVNKWLDENPERMQLAVDDAVKAGIAGCVNRSLDSRFGGMFQMLVMQAQNDGLLPRPQ